MGTANGAAAYQTSIMLRVGDGNKEFPLAGETRIGRESDCEIQIDDRCVSRYHLVVRVSEEGVFAEDLMSTNGTYLNGERLMKVERLKDGDELKIHDRVFRLAGVSAYVAPVAVGRSRASADDGVVAGADLQQLSDSELARTKPIDSPLPFPGETSVPEEKAVAGQVAGMRKNKLSAIERQMLRERGGSPGA